LVHPRHDRRALPFLPCGGHHHSTGFGRGNIAGGRWPPLALHVKTGDEIMSDPTHGDDRLGLRTYLTPEEAKEFHKLFMSSFIGFTGVAVVAHWLVWMWRPWIH
jgi:light-harvesting complex 1 beta chain